MRSKLLEGNFQRCGQADNSDDIFCSSPHVAFLGSSMDEGMDFLVLADIQKSHAFGSMKLVCSSDKCVHRELGQIMGIMPHGLYGVRMEKCPMCLSHLADPL